MISIISAVAAIVVSALLTIVISTVIAGKAVKSTLEQIVEAEDVFMERLKNTIDKEFKKYERKER